LIFSKEGKTVYGCASWSSGPGAALPLGYFLNTGLRLCAGLFSPALCGGAGGGHDAHGLTELHPQKNYII
jgi:hypothetical protein